MDAQRFTVIDDGRVSEVPVHVGNARVRLSAAALQDALGWELKPRGLCRGDRCVTIGAQPDLVDHQGIDLAGVAQLLARPLASDLEERVAYLGGSHAERATQLASLDAPDFVLPDLDGTPHALSDDRGKKVLLVAYASWCGCRYDLPVWQAMHEELKAFGFTVITVALDKSPEDARPFIEAASPTHPALIDSEHVVADLYRIINVPTAVWIDERGRIARPNDVAFGGDMFKDITGIDPQPHLEALRRWVKEDRAPLSDDEIRRQQILPDAAEQTARAEFSLAWYLHRTGSAAAAERHFARADALAPHDFTIRRGSMPIRGKDPMGADFAELYTEWLQAGRPYYNKRSFKDDA